MKLNASELKFHELHEATLRSFVHDRKLNWEFRREASGRALEIVERIEGQPASVQPITPWELWKVAREEAVSSEFPSILGTSMLKEIYRQTVNWMPDGIKLVGVDQTSKLETDSPRPFLSQAEDLIQVPSGAEPPLGKFVEKVINVQAKPYKRAWRIEPKVLINDDKGVFSGIMDYIRNSAPRTLDRAIAAWFLSPAVSGEDSQAFYSASYHLNTITTALAANATTANTTLIAARVAMLAQTDPSGTIAAGVRTGGTPLGIVPRYLVTAPTLFGIAKQLCQNPTVLNDGGTVNVANMFAQFGIEPSEFRLYGDTTDWFLVADPGQCPAAKCVFLNGRTLPTIRAGWHTGGTVLTDYLDDSGYPLYPVHIEVNYPFYVNSFDFRGIYAAIVAGGT